MRVRTRRWWRDLAALRGRLLVLVLVVALGTGFALSLLQGGQHLRTSYDRMYEENALAHLYIHLDGPRVVGDPVAELKALGLDVSDAQGRLVLQGSLQRGGETWPAQVIGTGGDWPRINDLCVLRGDYADRDYTCRPDGTGLPAPGDDRAYLHAPFMDAHGFMAGDPLSLATVYGPLPLDVLGGALNTEFLVTTSHPEFLVPDTAGLAVVWADLGDLQAATGLDGAIDEILVRFPADAEAQARAALADFRDHPADWAGLGVARMEVRQDTFSYALAEGDVAGFFEISYAVAFIVALIAGVTIAISMRRVVQSQAHLVGVVRALGDSRGAVLTHYLLFAVAVGTLGALPGLAIGMWGGQAMAVWYQGFLDFPLLDLTPSWWLAGLAFALSVAAAVFGGLRAALLAAHAPILSTLHATDASPPGPVVRTLSRQGGPVWRMAVRNLTRRPRRTVYTLTSLGLALVVSFSMLAMIESMDEGIAHHFAANEEWDSVLTLAPGTRLADADPAVVAVPGVLEAEPFLSREVTFEDQDVSLRLVGLRSETFHHFEATRGGTGLAPRAMVVARPFEILFEDKTGKDLPDAVTLHHAGHDLSVRVAGVVQEPLGPAVYLPYETVQEFLGLPEPEVDGYYVREDGASAADFASIPGFVGRTEKAELEKTMTGFMSDFRDFALLFTFVGLGFGAVVILNTTSTTLDERQVEHATLKALGASDGTIVRGLFVEAAFQVAGAAVLGTVLGYGAALYLMAVLSTELRASIPLAVPWWVPAVSAVGMAAVTALGTAWGARKLRAIDLPAMVKELAR